LSHLENAMASALKSAFSWQNWRKSQAKFNLQDLSGLSTISTNMANAMKQAVQSRAQLAALAALSRIQSEAKQKTAALNSIGAAAKSLGAAVDKTA
jgi:ribosomal protein L11